jgi:hypothetical protein
MAARRRGGSAAGPADWLLAFLHGRDERRGAPPPARAGGGPGPVDWLSAFLAAAAAGVAAPGEPDGGERDRCDPRAGRDLAHAGGPFAVEGDTT